MAVRIIKGDVREKLAELPADYFDCIVTSPPYYGLRDYGCAGQIGLEQTLNAWLEIMVVVCSELRRVLKPSGVFFCNIGDSYACTPNGRSAATTKAAGKDDRTFRDKPFSTIGGLIKAKDLMLVPERLGIALQADGWWVRSHIIWAKKNPMPESCTDRPTSAHETIWMLTKAARYYWDAEAVKEEGTGRSSGKHTPDKTARGKGFEIREGFAKVGDIEWNSRSLRNVWHMASQPYPGSHFATFPTELAERCIKAGSSERGCCAKCGKPWVRQSSDKTLGWQPSCKCFDGHGDPEEWIDRVPSRILDPFAGAGTTGLVADRLGRDCTLIDLNIEYAEMALKRIKDDCPMFAEVAAE